MKNFLRNAGSFLIILLFIAGLYFLSYITGGELTTATSCSTDYIKGEYSLETVKKQCPNLKQQDLVKDINDFFNGKYSFSAYATREEILRDVENNF